MSLIESCGFPQKEGKRYGVMAVKYKHGEDVQANGCTMTSAEQLRKIAVRSGERPQRRDDQLRRHVRA